jgi:hypothetical protein
LTPPLFAQDYDFEIPEEEEPKIEFNGNLDAKWGILQANQSSPFYGLQFFEATEKEEYLSQYKLDFYLNGEYHHKQVGLVLKTFYQYVREELLPPSIFELYGSLNLSPKLNMSIGKRRYNWGKGYAFNPVGYVNAEKDPENPDLALAGMSSAYFSFNKSFSSGSFQNLSLSGVLLIPEAGVNQRFAAAENIKTAVKLYFLFKNIDIDLMTIQSKNGPRRYGMDFAANLRTNLEIHGEVSYGKDEIKHIIENDRPVRQKTSGVSSLFGLRYLSKLNTTFIAEYYHNNTGLTENEFAGYIRYLQNSLESNLPEVIAAARNNMSTNFRSRTLMRDYLYLKASQPEPFSWLYTSVSIFTIYNLADNSFLLSPQFGYKPFTNFEILLWPTFFLGDEITEYGGKQFQTRFEIWLRFFF